MTEPVALLSVTIPLSQVVAFVVMAVVTGALAAYLIRTNPPKDDTAFIGLGKEKYSDEELSAPGEE